MGNILGILAGAAFSGAFCLPKPMCFVAAVVAAVLVILVRR